MPKSDSKFWIGLAFGALGGFLAARRILSTPRMPNAKTFQRILTQKRGEIGASIFMARVQLRYAELKTHRPTFDNLVFDTHVIGNILPGLALYQILCEDGLTSQVAIGEIDELFEQWFIQFPPLNMRMSQLMNFIPQNFAVFRRLVSFSMEKLFPAPGWQYEVVADDDLTYAFDIHHCFYFDVLSYYDAPELTPVFCRLDDYLMEVLPKSIKWGRTQTIGMGAEYCNFRWETLPADD